MEDRTKAEETYAQRMKRIEEFGELVRREFGMDKEAKYPEPDAGLYDKYRVFREPKEAAYHPVEVKATWHNEEHFDQYSKDAVIPLEEVESFVFVLKPDTDPHARVALATYAASVRPTDPQLAADLDQILTETRYAEGRG